MSWADRVVGEWSDAHIERMWGQWVGNEVTDWLSRQRWDIFWTQTYKVATSEVGAAGKWLRCLADFNSHLQQFSPEHSVRECLWAIEPFASLASHHVHSLLSLKSPWSLTAWKHVWPKWKEWAWKHYGKALILRTQESTPIWYCLKYSLKEMQTSTAVTTSSITSELSTRVTSRTKTPKSREKLWGIWTPDRPGDTIEAWMEDGP